MSRKRRPRPADPPRRRWGLLCAVAAMALGAAVAVRIWLRPTPDQLIRQAAEAYARKSAATEPLLLQAIGAAGGYHLDAELMLCCARARQGDWPEVANRFRSLDLSHASPEWPMELGRLAFAGRQWELAERALQHVSQIPNAHQVEALSALTVLFHQQGRTDEMIAGAEALTRAAPSDPIWWHQLAGVYESFDDPRQASEVYRRAIRQPLPDKELRTLRHKLVEQLIALGAADEARRELQQLEAEPPTGLPSDETRRDRARIDVEYARLLRLEGRPEEALPAIDRALVELADSTPAHQLRGLLLLDVGNVEQAVVELSRVVREKPDDEVSHYKLAEAYRRLGQTDRAAHHLKEYDRIHRASDETRQSRRSSKPMDGAKSSN